jgi:hypothetical protein
VAGRAQPTAFGTSAQNRASLSKSAGSIRREAMDYAEEDTSELLLHHVFDGFERLGDEIWSEDLVGDVIERDDESTRAAEARLP